MLELMAGRMIEVDVEKIIIAKKIPSADPAALSRVGTPGEAIERAAMIRKRRARCKRDAFGQKCPVRPSLDPDALLRNAPACGFVFV
jgi:hypothetical protein